MLSDESSSPTDRAHPGRSRGGAPREWVLATLLLGLMGLSLLRLPGLVTPPDQAAGAPFADAALKLDPNTAAWWELTVLEGIGPQRARAIVAYREAHPGVGHDKQPVFHAPADLERVPGIGPKTVDAIRSQLSFEDR